MAVANARLQQLINKTTGRKVVVHYDKILGKGGYGIVYQATLDGDEVAAKELQFEFAMKVDVSKFIEECLLLNEVSSKPCHIVHFHGVYKSPPSALGQAPRLFIIMERMESSLYEFESYGQVSRDSVVEILRNVADGLQTLHSSNLIHRDLTPGNVLLKTDPRTRRIEAKISDLGVARRLLGNESKLTACPGTYSFMPPEAFHCPTVYNEKLDIYSFGLLMVYLLCGKLPNSHDAPFGARKLLSRAFMKHVGAHLFRLIERCLAKDPDLRPTAEDVLEYFNNRKTFKVFLSYILIPKLHDKLSTSIKSQTPQTVQFDGWMFAFRGSYHC